MSPPYPTPHVSQILAGRRRGCVARVRVRGAVAARVLVDPGVPGVAEGERRPVAHLVAANVLHLHRALRP
eukprot:6166567-Prymnesium_polylepis.1